MDPERPLDVVLQGNKKQAKETRAMLRPAPGPLWPSTDDLVENSLRRAYLRPAPRIAPKPDAPDGFSDLLDHLREALNRPEIRRTA